MSHRPHIRSGSNAPPLSAASPARAASRPRAAAAFAALALAALVFAAYPSPAMQTGGEADDGDAAGFDKYQAIIDRSPFGKPPPVVVAGDDFTFLENTPELDAAELRLSDMVRIVSLTKYQDKPAAGFVDKRSGKSALLLVGQSMGDFALESVSFAQGSAVVSKGAVTQELFIVYAAGQPANLTASSDSAYLSVLDVRNKSPAAAASASAEPADGDAASATPAALSAAAPAPAAGAASDLAQYSAEDIAAATVVDENGEARVSFRELHRIRVQRERDKVENERIAREEKTAADTAAREQKTKDDAEAAAKAAEAVAAKHRRDVIEDLKAGYSDVNIDFDLSDAEKRELSNAGYDIPGLDADATPAAPVIVYGADANGEYVQEELLLNDVPGDDAEAAE